MIGLPNGVFENAISTDISEVQDVYTFYSLQIQLRRTLNRAHNLVYGPENRERKLPVWLNEEFFSPGEMLQELQGFRKIIDRSGTPPSLRGWNDNDPTSDNINVSRIRGKYYGARYMIMRPFLQHALTYTISPSPQYQNVGSADQHIPKIKLLDLRDPSSRKRRENRLSMKVDEEQNLQIIRGAKICIDAAMSSTIAFDGHLPNRFLVTNIHGTALAYVTVSLVSLNNYLFARVHLFFVPLLNMLNTGQAIRKYARSLRRLLVLART